MQEFNRWNFLKQKIEKNEPEIFTKEGYVWMANIGKNIGFEQNGSGNNFSRPLLIIKKFNNHMFWIVPLSSKQKKLDFYFNYIDINGQKVSAVLAQLRLVSVKRLKRKMYEIDPSLLIQIKNRIRSYL